MVHHKQGNAPGIDTPTEKAAGVSQDSKRLKTDNVFATEIIAVYARIKGAIVHFASWMAIAVRGMS